MAARKARRTATAPKRVAKRRPAKVLPPSTDGEVPPDRWSTIPPSQTHFGSRCRAAAGKVPLDEFWTFQPVRCTVCKRLLTLDKLVIADYNFEFTCIDRADCKRQLALVNKRYQQEKKRRKDGDDSGSTPRRAARRAKTSKTTSKSVKTTAVKKTAKRRRVSK